jgi:hypothetical protein
LFIESLGFIGVPRSECPVKIPLNAPLPAFGRKKILKGDDTEFSPLVKGSQRGFVELV